MMGTPAESPDMWVAGIDGCPSGWFVIEADGKRDYDHRVVESIETAVHATDPPALALVDTPIGLLETPGQRPCDRLARRALSPTRHASVFTPPCRQALEADSYEAANERNQAAVGKGLQRQAWHIADKIRELDRLLRDTPTLQGIIREAHPEVGFWGLTSEPMAANKRTQDGRQSRLAVLRSVDPTIESVYADAVDRYQRSTVGRDDIIDALCLAVIAARRMERGTLATLPADPPTDPFGHPMEMVYWPKASGTAASALPLES
ncbi:MAG: DUF429 domain-containing protein [Halobacteriales archaeon]